MKKILIALLILISFYLNAQVPQAFSYQGVAFDAEGAALSEVSISIEIKILRESAQGTTVYSEQHTINTNAAGLYNLNIGQGTSQQGEFENIDWSSLPMFISVGLDADGSGTFQSVGTSQLLSVPYALRAGAAEVEPIIFVEAFPSFVEPGGPVAIVSNRSTSQYSGIGSINFYYDWIQGTPEDVYIEIQGLPDNISVFSAGLGGFSHSSSPTVESTNGMDTIFYGQLQRRITLGRNNIDLNVPNGLYPLTLIFKTKDKVLDSINYNLQVITNNYDDCIATLPITKAITSNDCTEITSILEPTITLTEFDISDIKFTQPISNEEGSLSFFIANDCSRTNIEADGMESIDDITADINNMFFEGGKCIFEIELSNNVTSTVIRNCRVTYE